MAGMHPSNKTSAKSHTSGDEGGSRAVLDVTHQKSSISENCCCSHLLASESL